MKQSIRLSPQMTAYFYVKTTRDREVGEEPSSPFHPTDADKDGEYKVEVTGFNFRHTRILFIYIRYSSLVIIAWYTSWP